MQRFLGHGTKPKTESSEGGGDGGDANEESETSENEENEEELMQRFLGHGTKPKRKSSEGAGDGGDANEESETPENEENEEESKVDLLAIGEQVTAVRGTTPSISKTAENRKATGGGRARFIASRAAPKSGEEAEAAERQMSKSGGDDGQEGSDLNASSQESLVTEEAEASAEAQSAERELQEAEASLDDEHKLLAAEQEAEEARNGLKACAQGSFLRCRESRHVRHRRPSRGRIVG
ncbi:hypothetical protein cyc_04481 [Cyclospora cayetanensis]|uniref:Uncharacterized protein n=1 Tax=Cyclospora cayetanensis TaxID=88456 RepID=A0A1D3D4A1_9EIME|nr:hypothetical protein cyc_04481 [Cyclospora cayetanensis]